MKHNILRMVLLCMVMICGAGTAWGQTILETIGNTDFSTGYLGAESNTTKQTLEGDGTVHFKFVNHNNGGSNWLNYLLVVRSTESPSNPLIVLRADNWEDVAGGNTGCNSNFDFSPNTFVTDMNGATVDMNITRSGTTFSMTSTITTTASKVYNYSYNKTDISGAITVGLSVNAAYLEVLEASSEPLEPQDPSDEPTVLYERGFETDWTNADLTDWNAASNVAINANGIGVNANQTVTYVNKTFSTSENAIIEYDVTWVFGTATGRESNYNYIDFGSIRIAINSTYNVYISTNGGATWKPTTLGYYYNQTKTAQISLTINTKSQRVESFSFDGTDHTSLINSDIITNANTVKTGFIRGGSVSWGLDNYIKAIRVTEEIRSVELYDYSINYIYNANTIKTDSGQAEPGTTINAESPIVIDGQKYYATSGTSLVIDEEASNILNVELRKAYDYSWSVSSNLETTIASGVGVEDETVSYGYARYILKSTDLYSTARQSGNPWWGRSILLDRDNKSETINYSNPITGVVYYSEAEDIEGVTPVSTSNADIRCSGKAGGYANGEVTFTTLPAGRYILSTSVWGNAGTTITFKAGEEVIGSVNTAGSIQDYSTAEFTLEESTEISFSGTNASHPIDFIFIRSLQTVEYTVNYYLAEDHSTSIHSEKRTGFPGSKVYIPHSSVTIGHTTYTWASDNSEDVIINADGSSVVNVYLNHPSLHWTLVTSLGNELASGYGENGQEYKIHYPRHVVNDSKQLFYANTVSATDKEYVLRFTLTQNDQVETVQYYRSRVDNVDVNNIELLCEGEDIPGITVLTAEGFLSRTSNGAAGYSWDEIVLATGLRSGKYKLTINTYNGSGSSTQAADPYNFKVTIDGEPIMSFVDNANGLTQSVSTEFGIKDESIQLVMPAGFAGADKCGIDNFYLERVGDFVPTPTIARNLRSNYKVEVNNSLMMTIAATDVLGYQWYKWNGTADEFATAKTTFLNGGQEIAASSHAEIINDAKTNSYSYAAGDTPEVTERFFCQVKGFENNAYTVLASITTIEEVDVTSVMVPFYNEGYDQTTVTGWIGTAVASVVNHAAQITNGATGGRDMYMQLSQEFDYAPVNDGTWSLDFDFQPTDNSPATVSIYNKTYGIPTANTIVPNENAFFALRKNGANYVAYLNNVNKGSITLENGKWYHVYLKVEPNGTNRITASVTESTARAIPFNATSTEDLATGMDLGGIHCFMDRNAKAVNYDNIVLKVNSTDVLIDTDLPTFVEGNDDYYINDGDGLNFDVPAATEFEWYVSSVAPSKTANGTTAPRLEEDGSITWTGHAAFMTVESPVDRSSTSITKTNGVATNNAENAQSKHAVTPTADNEGKYAMQLVGKYTGVKTVWDEATEYHYNDGEDKTILRYYPEATASGSRWHYLRQLDIEHAESDHIDYVWCVAKNALGEVTSKVSQITIYPMQPQIYLEEEYFTEDVAGARADMTLPAIYLFRNYGVKIHAQNLIFNTANMAVPYATKSIIHYRDEERHFYEPTDPVPTPSTQWKYGDNVWSGVISTTTFSGFDETLEKNASVHGFYKSIPVPLPVDFAYGLLQQRPDIDYHDVTKGHEKNSVAEYVIGPSDNSSLQATQDIHFDYGRYKEAEVQLGTVNTKSTWDWSKLPERKFLTYNKEKYTSAEDIKKYIYTIPNSDPAVTFVVDPETGLGGPVMGNEYVMANFYGYGTDELEDFPSDKVKIGLEVVNDPANKCMQGNAFIIKPQHSGTLELRFSSADDDTDGDDDVNRYLELCTRTAINAADVATVPTAYNTTISTKADDIKTLTMTITDEMVHDGKLIVIRARNTNNADAADGTKNHYFRLYSATYTPDADPVTFTEWKVKEREMQASGGIDQYVTANENSDGFISLATSTPGAVIKYKIIKQDGKTDEQLNAIAADIDNLDAEEQTYKEDVYVDYEMEDENTYHLVDGEKVINHKIGIHCSTNSTIFAWTEVDGRNPSEVTWYKTKAKVYPVDMRFMEDFDNSHITTQEVFDRTYWDYSGTIHQSNLGNYTDLSNPDNITVLKGLSTPNAPKAWNATWFGKALIDGVEYTEANFEKFFITHGTTIDIFVNPDSRYKFVGWGAPSFDDKQDKVVDMMRSGEKASHVHYHLLYDKAKAATTAGIAFLIANFTDRTEPLTAQVKVTDETHDLYSINVDAEDMIIAPVYHTAHKADGQTVTHWTDDYGLGDTDETFEDYTPGVKKQIYENTVIKPVYRDNKVADNYRGRTKTMHATWWFTTDHNAQPLTVREVARDFYMPYVAPVRRHEIGTAVEGADDDLWFDLPMIITPTTSGRLDNTIVPDWCSVGRGTTFTLPACPGAVVEMEVRSKISDAETGTKFGGLTPTLCKVKYQGDNDYTDVTDPALISRTVESYVYTATYTGDEETLDIVLGNDYSYIRNISLTLPVIISKRDAALVTLDFSELAQHLDLASLAGYDDFSEKPARKPYNQGHTGDGYQFDHETPNVSLYKTHYSGEDGAIYYNGVSAFQVMPGQEVPENVPYVNGALGYTYSTSNDGTFIVGPFRSITHIRYKQGSSRLEGGGWTMTVGRMDVDWDKEKIQQNDLINKDDDPRRVKPDFSSVEWKEPKFGGTYNSTAPEWVEMDIEEHIYPNGEDNTDISLIEGDSYDDLQGDIWLRFHTDKSDVYLFAIEIYGIASTSEQQAMLETNIMVAENDDATQYEPSFVAGEIFHFPYLLRLDEQYDPISSLQDTDDKILQYNEGHEVTLTANPNTGYAFLKWIKADEEGNWEDVSHDNPYKFNLDDSRLVRAVFVPQGIINYTTTSIHYGLVPEPVQTNQHGGFTVAENRSLFAGNGQTLRRWQDTDSKHDWYKDNPGQDSTFAVSTNIVGKSTSKVISRSRAELGMQIDVTPQFTANQLELLDVVGRIGSTARWIFGKKNGAPTMEGNETTPRLVTQTHISGNKDVLQDGAITTLDIKDTIDVNLELKADINNAGRADAYATIQNGGQFTMPATKGMKVEIVAATGTAIQYSTDGENYTDYTEPIRLKQNANTLTLWLKNADGEQESFELEYIQATYHQRAQTPILSMQNVDVITTGEHTATNNVQVQVQTKSNPTATRFYTLDGSDPQYIEENGTYKPANSSTRLVRGNYITINETQIGSGTMLKVLSVVDDHADSEIATLDLKPYNADLGLATYVYDSRIIDIHEDQIFKKLMAEHEGHFNLLSYDLNPDAAVIPSVITDHTTVFVTSDAVREHLMTALTTPSDPAAHGQTFSVEPLIVGTPLYISWKQNATTGEWQDISWVLPDVGVKPEPVSNTVTYTEAMSMMKNTVIRNDLEDDDPETNRTYAQYYDDQIQANGGEYILTFFDNMLMQTRTVTINAQEVTVNDVCISNTMDNAPENLSHNGTQLVFNATELLTRKTNGVPADVSTFNKTILTLMAPTSHPQLTGVKLTDTFEITDQVADGEGYVNMTAQMLSALSDGLAVMPQPYLANEYPQFEADRDGRSGPGKGKVEIQNVETWLSDADGDITTVEKIGAQGVKDLATIITVTDPAFSGDPNYAGDPDFQRVYRVEYSVPLDSITFHKEGDVWVCNESDLYTLTESKNEGQPTYKFLGPINMGIKDVCFNGYAVAPEGNFEDGEVKSELNDDGTPMYSIWGRGEKFEDSDPMPSPTAYLVDGTFIPEYPDNSEEEMHGLPEGQWMESHFTWGFKDCNQMAFTLLNINEYVGDIKIRYYRRQAENPKLIETNIYNDMMVPANGEFRLTFNSVMHQVRQPGRYHDADVEWTAHIIPDDLGDGVSYGNIRDDYRKIDRYDLPDKQIMLSSEGGSSTLTFHYWHLEEGKKYWLHIPFHIMRSDVGESLPYEFPAEGEENDYEREMQWTDYDDGHGEKIPFFDIPFYVARTQYDHDIFDYIVNNDSWWDAYKDTTKAAHSLPNYAKWDGTFAHGIEELNSLGSGRSHPHFYMHVQKQFDNDGNPVAYSLGSGDAGCIEITTGNFSIVGEGRDSTVIYAMPTIKTTSGSEGLREGNNNATLHIDGNDIYLQDLTIENGQEGSKDKDVCAQEYPAVHSHGSRHTFYNVEMKAYEESYASFGTLGYLERCLVSGYGDFIVGSGDVWFEQCQLLLRNQNMINLCAPTTKATEQWGFVFNDCHIDREEGASNVIDHNWTLARPWKGYDTEVTKSPAATFIDTKITVLPTNTGYGSLDEGLHLRFHEYGTYKNNIENPAPLSMRSVANCKPTLDSDYPVLTKDEADEYTIGNVFGRDNNGYDPQTQTAQSEAPFLTNDGMVLHWKANREDFCYLVYYLGDDVKPDWEHAMMFCCVPGTNEEEAYCYLTNHDLSPIFRTGGTDTPIAFSELWYGKRKVNGGDEGYNDDDLIDGMGKESPSRLWFAVRAANQMGGLSPMSNPLEYHAARQYRTSITEGGVRQGDDSGNAYSTIYLDFQALAPKGVKAYALTDVSTTGGDGTGATTLSFTRVSNSDNPNHQDVIYADQGYLLYGPYGKEEGKSSMNHIFIETTSYPDIDLFSYLSGTVGEFLNFVSETGYGELNGVNSEIGWSIAPRDYDNIPKVNIAAYTLQKYHDVLGFYKYTGANFGHHRAYLDTDVAAQFLMDNEGMTLDEAISSMNRGIRIIIRENDGRETIIEPTPSEDDAALGIFDLMGRQIPSRKHLQHGQIYIINGEKVLWK